MAISKEEQKLLDCIRSIYNQPITTSFRPDFLKNEKTGKNLEIDIYLSHHRVGFEYQGAIHFRDIKEYRNDSDDSRRTDNLKNEMIENQWCTGIAIVEMFPQDLSGDIKQNLLNRLLITQEVLFNKHHFTKCARLETLYLYLLGIKNKASSKFLDRCAAIRRRDKRKHSFKNLISAMEKYLADPGIHKNGREKMFDINHVCEISNLSVLYGKLLNERHYKSLQPGLSGA